MDDATLGGMIAGLGPDMVEALSTDSGELRGVSAVRLPSGELEIHGRVRYHGTDYDRGQFSEGVPLMRLRLHDPLGSFLLGWINTGPPIAPTPRAGIWSLSAKARLIRVPTMTEEQRAEAMRRYEPVALQAADLDTEIARREADIETHAARLYGLTPAMEDTVRISPLPSEVLGWEEGGATTDTA